MSVALRVYEQLTDAGEDKARARAIADGFEQLEERYAPLKDTATQGHLRETELRLQKEIREVELKLANDIREVELKLTKEIEAVRLEIRAVEVRIAEVRSDLIRWVVAAGFLQSSLIIAVLLKVSHLI